MGGGGGGFPEGLPSNCEEVGRDRLRGTGAGDKLHWDPGLSGAVTAATGFFGTGSKSEIPRHFSPQEASASPRTLQKHDIEDLILC